MGHINLGLLFLLWQGLQPPLKQDQLFLRRSWLILPLFKEAPKADCDIFGRFGVICDTKFAYNFRCKPSCVLLIKPGMSIWIRRSRATSAGCTSLAMSHLFGQRRASEKLATELAYSHVRARHFLGDRCVYSGFHGLDHLAHFISGISVSLFKLEQLGEQLLCSVTCGGLRHQAPYYHDQFVMRIQHHDVLRQDLLVPD